MCMNFLGLSCGRRHTVHAHVQHPGASSTVLTLLHVAGAVVQAAEEKAGEEVPALQGVV
jgi:hypothetical protein